MIELTKITAINQNLAWLFQKVAIAILIGIFIGVERERKKKPGEKYFGGIRTFPLVALFGFLSAMIASFTEFYLYAIFFLIFGVTISISYYFAAERGEIGGTTEIALFIVFILGSLVFWEMLLVAAAIAVVVQIFLAFKSELRTFAGEVNQEDIIATIKFLVLTIIVLPILPNKEFGPFNAFNPHKVWLVIILIATVSFTGYILFKIIGANKGIALLSFLGGIASSTALTLSFTQKSKEVKDLSRNFAAGIILASSIMFPRLLFIIFVANQKMVPALAVPFLFFTVVGVISSGFIWKKSSKQVNNIDLTNPFKILFALKFGLVFLAILFIAKASQFYFGNSGVYLSGFFSGFADLDAIALSLSELSKKIVSINVAVNALILAGFANTIVKLFIPIIFGSKELRKFVAIGFAPLLISFVIYFILI